MPVEERTRDIVAMLQAVLSVTEHVTEIVFIDDDSLAITTADDGHWIITVERD